MPKYTLKGETYNIPDEKAKAFESKYPDASVSFETKEGKFNIPAAKKDAFLSKYPDAKPFGSVTHTEEVKSPVDNVVPLAPASSYVEGTGKDTKVFGMPYEVFNKLKPESKVYYYQEEQRKRAEGQANHIRQRAEGQYGAAINSEIDKQNSFSTEHPTLSAFVNVVSDKVGGQMNAIESSTPVMAAKAAMNKTEGTQEIIDTSRRKADGSSTVSEVGRGFYNKAKKLGTWDFGITDMKDSAALLSAAKKKESGQPVTPEEDTLLESAAAEAAANDLFDKDVSTAYKVGEGAAQTASYGKDFALSGGLVGLGKVAVQKFGVEAAKKTIAQIAKNAALRVGGDVLGATGMATTVHAGTTLADTFGRMTGNAKYNVDGSGYVSFDGMEGGEGLGTALPKAIGNTVIEDYSELVGGYFGGITKAFGKGVGTVADKVGLKKIHEAVAAIPASAWGKAYTDFARKTQYNGFVGEYGEELVGTALNAAFVGDSKFSDLIDPNIQKETFLSVAFVSGLMGGANIAGYRTPKYTAKKNLGTADNYAGSLFADKWPSIKESLEQADDDQKVSILDGILSSNDLNDEKKQAVSEYVARLQIYNGANVADVKRRMEGEVSPDQLSSEDEYGIGMSLYTPEQKNEAKKALDSTMQGLSEDDMNALNGEDPLNYIYNYDGDPSSLLGYYNAKARYDGMIQSVRDNIDDKVQDSNREIDHRTASDGNIYDVTLKADDNTHYNIVKDAPIFNEDGTADLVKSPEYVFARDDSGKIQMIPTKDVFKLFSTDNSEELKLSAEDTIRNQEAKAAADEIDGVRTFVPGENVTINTPSGPANVIVNAVTPDGEVEVYSENNEPIINGEVSAVLTNRELSQLVGDTLNENTPTPESVQSPNNTQNEQNDSVLATPTPENADVAQVGQSNVSEDQPIEQKEAAFPLDKEGNVDYKQISDPVMYSSALKTEFGEEAPSIIGEEISNQQKQLQQAEKKGSAIEKARAKKRISTELARLESIKNILTPVEQNVVPADVTTDAEYAEWVAENSDDALELAEAYNVAKEESSKENTLLPWQRELLGRKINAKSFNRFGDRNKINGTFAKSWLRKDGEELDTLAQELSEFGKEVTENDIVDFMLGNPTNSVRTTSDVQNKIAGRFKEIASVEMGFSVGGPESNTGKLYLEYKKANHMIETEAQKKAFSDAVESDMIPAYERQTQSYIDFLDDEQMQALSSMRDEFEAAEYAEKLYEGMSIDEINEIYSQLNKKEDGQGEDSGDNDASKDGKRLEGEQERDRTDGPEEYDREAESENREDEIVSPPENKQEKSLSSGEDDLYLQNKNENVRSNIDSNEVPESISQRVDGTRSEIPGRQEKPLDQLRRRIEEASRDAQTSKGDGKEKINRMIEDQAKSSGLWLPIQRISNLGSPFLSGAENDVYLDAKNDVVYKVNNLLNSKNLPELFKRIDLHNNFFPQTKYQLTGFTGFGNGGDVYPIYKQEYVDNAVFATPQEIDSYMHSIGFSQSGEATYSNGKHEISDLRPRNVLKDPDGNIYVIDADFKKLKKTVLSVPEKAENESLFDYAEKVVKAKELSDEEQKVDTNPSEAQKEAGNYKMGHVKIGGYDVTIENPRGSERKGTDVSGKEWSTTMNNSYGYFRGTKGKDRDHIDVFLGENLNPETVYVVDQVNSDGSFDEHKVMFGFNSEQEAREAYLSNYEVGWTGLGNITGVPKDVFDKWMSTGTKKQKAFADYKHVEAASITTDQKSDSNTPLFRETNELEEIKDKAIADGSFMKAPNGKDSNLDEQQWLQVRTSEFKNWFGDWENDPENASKVVDENREPMVVYHGTDAEFHEFKSNDRGLWFTQDEKRAAGYAKVRTNNSGNERLVGAFLDIKNPSNSEYSDDYVSYKDQGYDGWISRMDDGRMFSIVATHPNQIKSATENTGEFSSKNDDIRFREESNNLPEVSEGLVVLHNTSPDNLIKSARAGGFAMPSIAITKADNRFLNYGDISLIAGPNMIDPKIKGNKVFSADAFSPRYPRIEYRIGNAKVIADASEKLSGRFKDGIENSLKIDIERDGDANLANNEKMMVLFALSKGADIVQNHKSKHAGKIVDYVKSIDGYDFFEVRNNDEVKKKFSELYLSELDDNKKTFYEKRGYVSKDGVLDDKLIQSVFNDIKEEIRNEGNVDGPATFENAKKYIEDNNLTSELQDYANDLYDKLDVDERIFKGYAKTGAPQYMPHTAENAVSQMKSGELTGVEGLSGTMGRLRSKLTPEFKSLKAIKASEDKIATQEEFRDGIAKTSEEYYSLEEKLRPYFKFGGNSALGLMVDFENDVKDLISKGESQSFNKLPDELQNEIRQFAKDIVELPTEYFEAKPQRVIRLDDFSAAVIPSNTDSRVKKILDDNNIPYREYSNQEERLSYVRDVTSEMGLRFKESAKLASMNESQEAKSPIESEVTILAQSLNTPVRIIRDVNEITDDNASLQLRKRASKGWFDPKTGEVTIVLPNATSVADAQRTVLHEVVAHKGLRELFGKDFDTFLSDVYQSVSRDIRDVINSSASKKGWNLSLATEEYLASLAEGGNISAFGKIKALFNKMLNKIGINVNLTDNDLKYILWRSYKNLSKGNPVFDAAEDAVMRDNLFREEKSSKKEPEKLATENLAKVDYETQTKGLSYKLQESYQDSMLGLKKIQEAISKETEKKIKDHENAYMAENQMSSKSTYESEFYRDNYFNPLVDIIAKMTSKIGNSPLDHKSVYDEVIKYLMVKHGIERNKVFAERDAANDVPVRDDYSGLRELTGEEEEFNAAAETIISEFEDQFTGKEIVDLWEKVNSATKQTLKKTYESGMMSKATYEKVNSMFEYYVPLRGWSEDTAADVYDYITSERSAFNAPVKSAKGRSSVADDPIATIGNMAESAILQGNRNMMKQKFLNMVLNHPTSLATVKDMWCINKGTDEKPVWEESYPDIPAEATADEVNEAIEDHERRMEELRSKGLSTKAHAGLNISYRASKKEKAEHIVNVKRGGKDYVIYVNGNPRAAQAINGTTNPDANDHKIITFIGRMNRQLAANFTTRNPAFVLSNLSRDLIFSSTAIAIKENGKYSRRFIKNLGSNTPAMIGMLYRYQQGKLDMNNSKDRYFKEFLENGGETGYTALHNVDEYKKLIERKVLSAKGQVDLGRAFGLKPGKVMTPTTLGVLPAFQFVSKWVEFGNRCAEDTSRFTTYMTSRQMGRTVMRSVSDAKEVTVNFNKKGAGGFGATTFKSLYLFFNAAVQSLNNFYRLAKNNKGKFGAAIGSFTAAGLVVPLMNDLLISMFGGPDDRDKYDNLPDWVRKNNICLWIGGDKFLTIPLPIELRAFYGMGEMSYQWSKGNMRHKNVALEMANQLTELLPLNLLGNDGDMIATFMPDAGKPIYQSMVNKDFFGKPIYKKSDFNELMPEYTKAFSGTNKALVSSAEFLNSVSGGDKYKVGTLNINPAVVEHLFESYLGGVGKTINQTGKTISMIWDEDQRVTRNVPIINRFLGSTDDRNAFSRVNEEYYHYVDEFKKTEQRVRGYKKEADSGVLEYAEKVDFLYNSPEYKRYEIIKEYQREIKGIQDDMKASDGEDKNRLLLLLNTTKAQLVEQLDQTEK